MYASGFSAFARANVPLGVACAVFRLYGVTPLGESTADFSSRWSSRLRHRRRVGRRGGARVRVVLGGDVAARVALKRIPHLMVPPLRGRPLHKKGW